MRIVSLLPSATEIICAVGQRHHLVGVTHECDFPLDVRELPVVTQSRIPIDASSREIDTIVREQSIGNALADGPAFYSLKDDVLDGSAFFNRSGPRLVDSLEQLSEIFVNQ